jgi:hypothetical protein
LRVQDTQRILKIARDTDDSKILAGIATALVSASFLRIAEAELILKLLRFDSNTLLASVLFMTNKVLIQDRDPASLTKEIGLIEEVARGVLGKPEAYPFQTVCQASDFLAEHNRVELLVVSQFDFSSIILRMSSMLHNLSVTPASIAGVTLNVLCIRTKL